MVNMTYFGSGINLGSNLSRYDKSILKYDHVVITYAVHQMLLYNYLPRTAHRRLFCTLANLPHVKHNLKCRLFCVS